jgi:DNA-binding response OmpR family regulator
MIYHLLSVGPVASLLNTRNAVLRHAGFRVETSSDLNEALSLFLNGDFDAAILCHSVPARDKERFVRIAKEQKPLTPLAVMSDGAGPTAGADLQIQNLDGPEELLRQVAEVIAASRAPRRGTP